MPRLPGCAACLFRVVRWEGELASGGMDGMMVLNHLIHSSLSAAARRSLSSAFSVSHRRPLIGHAAGRLLSQKVASSARRPALHSARHLRLAAPAVQVQPIAPEKPRRRKGCRRALPTTDTTTQPSHAFACSCCPAAGQALDLWASINNAGSGRTHMRAGPALDPATESRPLFRRPGRCSCFISDDSRAMSSCRRLMWPCPIDLNRNAFAIRRCPWLAWLQNHESIAANNRNGLLGGSFL